MTRKVTFVEIIMIISEMSNVHETVGILSKNTSGSGGYLVLSGTFSCTRARDAVVSMKFTTNIIKAET
jgi:hypothetical protein